jgi:hypothetical protein
MLAQIQLRDTRTIGSAIEMDVIGAKRCAGPRCPRQIRRAILAQISMRTGLSIQAGSSGTGKCRRQVACGRFGSRRLSGPSSNSAVSAHRRQRRRAVCQTGSGTARPPSRISSGSCAGPWLLEGRVLAGRPQPRAICHPPSGRARFWNIKVPHLAAVLSSVHGLLEKLSPKWRRHQGARPTIESGMTSDYMARAKPCEAAVALRNVSPLPRRIYLHAHCCPEGIIMICFWRPFGLLVLFLCVSCPPF